VKTWHKVDVGAYFRLFLVYQEEDDEITLDAFFLNSSHCTLLFSAKILQCAVL
jgi:hypothetical protein